jgi:hypothetical protein
VLPPFFLNGVLNLASLFILVFGLIVPSYLTVVFIILPVLLHLYVVVIGTISASNHPFFFALAAFYWDAHANSSCSFRLIPNFAATF